MMASTFITAMTSLSHVRTVVCREQRKPWISEGMYWLQTSGHSNDQGHGNLAKSFSIRIRFGIGKDFFL